MQQKQSECKPSRHTQPLNQSASSHSRHNKNHVLPKCGTMLKSIPCYIVSMGISILFSSGEILCGVNGNSIIILQIFITFEKVYIVSMKISLLFYSGEFLYCVNGNLNTFLHWRKFILCQWEFSHNSLISKLTLQTNVTQYFG